MTINFLYHKRKIELFVIDEVHCVYQWGLDFRRDYLGLGILKEKYPEVPILGLTATTTVIEKGDIARCLRINDNVIFF